MSAVEDGLTKNVHGAGPQVLPLNIHCRSSVPFSYVR